MAGREEALERVRQWPTRRGHQGPASDLPTADPEEIYSSRGPYLLGATPFGFDREFDLTNLSQEPAAQGWQQGEYATIGSRAREFIDQYFGGEDSPVNNPKTGRPYGTELRVHDAMHQFANVGNTLRGEELISIAEKAASTPLVGAGLDGLTQQQAGAWEIKQGKSPGDLVKPGLDEALSKARMSGPVLAQVRGRVRGSSLFRDGNNPAAFLSPPISQDEFATMVQRGREFYDQVHNAWIGVREADGYSALRQMGNKGDRAAEARADEIRQNFVDRSPGVLIRGGYKDPGGMPYGDIRQFMNPPLTPTVDEGLYAKSMDRQLSQRAEEIKAEIEGEKAAYMRPEAVEAREAPRRWEMNADRLRESELGIALGQTSVDGVEGFEALQEAYARAQAEMPRFSTTRDHLEAVLGPKPQPPRFDEHYPVSRGVYDYGAAETNLVSSFGPEDFDALKDGSIPLDAAWRVLDDVSGRKTGGRQGAAPAVDGRLHLNPANLGATAAQKQTHQWRNLERAVLPNAGDMMLTAAAEAKQAEGYARMLPRVKGAIGTGVRGALDITTALPVLNPEFRGAVERGDGRKAGEALVKDVAAGVVTAPVMGTAAGVAQRLAPGAASTVLPALGVVANVAGPVGVVSQLGGSAKPSQRQQSVERQQDPGAYGAQGPSANPQLLKAEAARRRGSRWKVGPFGIPELGISEAGGLAARDASQLLNALSPSRGQRGTSQGRRRGAARSR